MSCESLPKTASSKDYWKCLVTAWCSVGPTCSEALLATGTAADLEPEHGKMGLLVHEAARKAPDLLRHKTKG